MSCFLVSDGRLQAIVMPRNFIFLSIQLLVAKGMTKAFFEDRADQWYRLKCISIRSLHSWMHDTICNPTKTLSAILLNTISSIAQVTSTCRKTRHSSHLKRTCWNTLMGKNSVPLDLLRLSWWVVTLMLMVEDYISTMGFSHTGPLRWRSRTTISHLFNVLVCTSDCCPSPGQYSSLTYHTTITVTRGTYPLWISDMLALVDQLVVLHLEWNPLTASSFFLSSLNLDVIFRCTAW